MQQRRGQRFFRGRSAGVSLFAVWLDPAAAAQRRQGRAGSDPERAALLVRLFLPDGGTAALQGVVEAGRCTLAGDGWSGALQLRGATLEGELACGGLRLAWCATEIAAPHRASAPDQGAGLYAVPA